MRVDREEIWEIIDQMRATIPEEIKQARWIVKERQEMLAEAKREAERMIAEAREQAAREASQQEVVKLAERQAEDVLAEARRQDREIRLGAEDYADDPGEPGATTWASSGRRVQRGREQLRGEVQRPCGNRRSITKSPSPVAWRGAPMVDLRALRSGTGEVPGSSSTCRRRPLVLGGHDIAAALRRCMRVSAPGSRGGVYLRLRFRSMCRAVLRCLEDAAVHVAVDAPNITSTAGVRARTMSWRLRRGRRTGRRRWARDAMVLALPPKILCRPTASACARGAARASSRTSITTAARTSPTRAGRSCANSAGAAV